MGELFIYLIQINLLLSFIFLSYELLLKGITFYKLNRIYFIVGILYSLVFPFCDFSFLFQRDVRLAREEIMEYVLPPAYLEIISDFTLVHLLLSLIAVGAVVFFIKLLFQIGSLLRIYYHSEASVWKQYLYRNVLFPIIPFSFFNQIYVHRDQHLEEELDDIFKHETIHVRGLHSWDVILCEILLIICWYNPFVWLMRRAMCQNLEYLTDQHVLDKGSDRRSYQYSLLNVTKRGTSVGISNQFNFKTLKKRIIMMNKKRSSRLALGKYVFLFPFLILIGAGFTVKKAEKNINRVVDTAQSITLNENSVTKDTIVTVRQIEFDDIDFKGNYIFKIDRAEVDVATVLNMGKSTIAKIYLYSDQPSKDEGSNRKRYDGTISVMTNAYYKKMGQDTDNPLIIVDGKIMKDNNKSVKSMDANSIESIHILKDSTAVKKYGEEGSAGVIIITSKDEIKMKREAEKSVIRSEVSKEKETVVGKGRVFIGQQPSGDSKIEIKGAPIGQRGVQVRSVKEKANLLVILDGVEMNFQDLNKNYTADQFEHITMLKDSAAIARYGDKGKDGALIIGSKAKAIVKKPNGSF